MDKDIVFKILAHTSLGIYIIVLIWLLYSLRKMVRNQPTQFIYATLGFWLLLAAKDIAYLFGDIWYDTEVTNVLMSIDLWPTPIVSILLLYALQPKWLNLGRISCILTPFFVFTLLNIILKGNSTLFLINQVYGFAYATIMGTIIFILTFKCDIYINSNYSDKGHIDIKWVRNITIMMYGICAIWFLFSIESTWLGDSLYYLATTVLTALLFSFAMRHKEVVFPNYMNLNTILNKEEEDIDHNSNIIKSQFGEIEIKLERAITQDKIYLNPQLTLADLAKHIGTNRTYLSQYINNYKATPFINFINDMRCTEAQRILKETSHHSMIDIATECGFASYSTFRRVFKQKYGYAPSECRSK